MPGFLKQKIKFSTIQKSNQTTVLRKLSTFITLFGKFMKYMNLIAFLAMVAMNYLANALPVNGKTTGQFSDLYPNLFTPAAITFSIWGVIYFLVLVFVVVQLKADNQKLVSAIGWAFVFSSALNALWIFAWHYEQTGLSVLIMLGLLASLIFINNRLSGMPFSITKLAFGIYLGWICIATIANITALLVSLGWTGCGIAPESWTIMLIAVGAVITIFTMHRLQNPYLAFAVIWAFAGIIIKRHTDFQTIAIAAVLGIAVVGVVASLMLFKKTA